MIQRAAIVVAAVAVGLLVTASAMAGISVYGVYIDGNDLESGYGVGVSQYYSVVDTIGVDIRAGYVQFEQDNTRMVPLELTASIGLPVSDHLNVYTGLGIGYYYFSGGVALDNSFGYFPLLGIRGAVGPVSLFAESRWLYLQPDLKRVAVALPNTRAADLDGVGLSIGVALSF